MGTFSLQPFSHNLTFNFPWSLGYIRKLAFGCPWGNYFTPSFVCTTYGAQEFKLAQTPPLRVGNNSCLGWVEPRRYISCTQKKFTLSQCRIRTRDLSICHQGRYHWTNVPQYVVIRLPDTFTKTSVNLRNVSVWETCHFCYRRTHAD